MYGIELKIIRITHNVLLTFAANESARNYGYNV